MYKMFLKTVDKEMCEKRNQTGGRVVEKFAFRDTFVFYREIL